MGTVGEGADPAHLARVLVVDDEPDLRRLFRVVLTEGGYEVREAANGADALTLAGRGGRI